MASVARIRDRARIGVERRDVALSSARESSLISWLGTQYGYGVTGESVSSATTHGAVYACVSKIVGLFTAMTVTTWQTIGEKERQIPDPPIVANPSPDASLDQPHWLAQVLSSWLFRGDVFGTIADESPSGWPTKIDILDPDMVRSVTRDGKTTWWVKGVAEPLWTEGGRLWHVPSWMIMPGTSEGIDPISKAGADVGLGLAAKQYGAEWFRAGGHPTAVLENPQPVTGEIAAQVQSRWVEGMEGGARNPRVLGSGWTYKPMSISPDQANMLQMLQANTADVCRYFGVPPEEIGSSSGDTSTYANVEGRGVQMLRNMAPWLGLTMRMWSSLLPRGQTVRLDPSVMLRLTPLIEAQVWTERIRGAQYTPNEAREKLGLQPMVAGEELVWPPYSVRPAPTAPTPPTPPGWNDGADPNAAVTGPPKNDGEDPNAAADGSSSTP